jgi:hypothetical protein
VNVTVLTWATMHDSLWKVVVNYIFVWRHIRLSINNDVTGNKILAQSIKVRLNHSVNRHYLTSACRKTATPKGHSLSDTALSYLVTWPWSSGRGKNPSRGGETVEFKHSSLQDMWYCMVSCNYIIHILIRTKLLSYNLCSPSHWWERAREVTMA